MQPDMYSPLCFCMMPDPILITSHSKDITMAKSRKCIWAAGTRPLQRQAPDICRDSKGSKVENLDPQWGRERGETGKLNRA